MPNVNQIANIVNDAVNDALGSNAPRVNVTGDFVSLGKALSNYDAYDKFYKSLTNRIIKTVYFVRTIKTSNRNVLRDEHEFGAFIQKTYYEMPDAVDNPAYKIPDDSNQYKQASPYDVENVVKVTSIIFGTQGTWTIEIIRPEEQIKSAFTSTASMMSFIDGIYIAVENKFKLEEERVVAMAVNTSIANCINNSKARNLLAEYNLKHAGATLSVEQALESAEFLKYASKEINDTIDYMGKMSTVFNVNGYTTFTDKSDLVVEMLTSFASASDMYLQADTFHNELVKLPKFDKVPYWQGSGTSFSFADCSKVHVKSDELITGSNETGEVEQAGVICFLHDIENVAAYFGNRKSWEMYNPRSEVYIHGEKARKGYAVDSNANSFVFYIA